MYAHFLCYFLSCPPCLFQSSIYIIVEMFRTQEKGSHSDCIKYRNGSRRRFGGFIRWSWILTTDSHRPSRWKDHNSIGLFLASNIEISQENSRGIQKKFKTTVVVPRLLLWVYTSGFWREAAGSKKQFANWWRHWEHPLNIESQNCLVTACIKQP